MKHVVILGDGMADYPCEMLDNKTPLQAASKPNIDFIANKGVAGLVKTVPENLSPGSDVANLSVMGYDTSVYYTGRSPLEAVSMGISLKDTDITFRCNLVTLSDEAQYEDKVMLDYSAGEISTQEAELLIKSVADTFNNEFLSFYPGISYRHCLVWSNGSTNVKLTPPHDISLKGIKNYLPSGENSSLILEMMRKSEAILKEHPVNIERVNKGLRPATSIWLWGEGKKPILPNFNNKYNVNGAVISAVDLIKGIGIAAGLESIEVEGATGNIHTNFDGKAMAVIEQLESGKDFLYVHIEAPDECGHQNQINEKVRAIELIDEKVVGPILKALEKYDAYKIMVLPDHPTPLKLMTHTSEPVPFAVYSNVPEALDNFKINSSTTASSTNADTYDEYEAKKTNIYIEKGCTLMDLFLGKQND